jgi:hypothetical protein
MDVRLLAEVPPWDWPENAGEIFEETLLDRSASEPDRLLAAELAGQTVVMNDDLAETLLELIGDAGEGEALRAHAAISLGPVLEETDTQEFDDPYDEPVISEETFDEIRDGLHDLYEKPEIPKLVRRRILEAAVRSPQEWQSGAIREAYASGDAEWVLTAVFAMYYVSGFDDSILESLRNPDPQIHREAVKAAGNWEIAAAGPHVVALVEDPATPRDLLLVAIEAVGSLYPAEARRILYDLSKSEDEEIAGVVEETLMMAQGAAEDAADGDDEEDEDEDEEEADNWVN